MQTIITGVGFRQHILVVKNNNPVIYVMNKLNERIKALPYLNF